jgi:hypothetical protein
LGDQPYLKHRLPAAHRRAGPCGSFVGAALGLGERHRGIDRVDISTERVQ